MFTYTVAVSFRPYYHSVLASSLSEARTAAKALYGSSNVLSVWLQIQEVESLLEMARR